jgi:hypothetical protein
MNQRRKALIQGAPRGRDPGGRKPNDSKVEIVWHVIETPVGEGAGTATGAPC